ncbi:MAG: pyridoxamine 5'-phosphate oxidase family protein [bacterium]
MTNIGVAGGRDDAGSAPDIDLSSAWTAPLPRIRDAIWAELDAATKDRRHGFHVPVIASIGRDGMPSARSVVLRRALCEPGELHFHTDLRSTKVAEIAANPRVAWLLYDATRKIQLRIEAEAEVLRDGPRADEAWSRSALSSRRCYLAPHAPGEVTAEWTANIPEALAARIPTEEESAAGRANFGLVVTRATAIEWLYLASDGHRRARFVVDAARASWLAQWLAP